MPRQLKNPEDILGKKFGKLTPITFLSLRHNAQNRFEYTYLCLCDCGQQKNLTRVQLRTGQRTSCGCSDHGSKKENANWKGYEGISGSIWTQVRYKASKRNLPLTVTIVDLWDQFQAQKECCALTGVKLVLDSRAASTTASLDRIDSTKGYVKGNIQWVLKDINRMKTDFTQDHFIELCKTVAAYFSATPESKGLM